MSLNGKNISLIPYSSNHQELIETWMNTWDALYYYRDEVLLFPPEHQALEGLGLFIVVRNRDMEPLGFVRILDQNLLHRRARLDFHIIPQYRKSRYGIESVIVLMNYCFHYLNFHKVYLTIYESNLHAITVAKKLGYVHDGIMRQHTLKNNIYIDVHIFSLTINEFFESHTIQRLSDRLLPDLLNVAKIKEVF